LNDNSLFSAVQPVVAADPGLLPMAPGRRSEWQPKGLLCCESSKLGATRSKGIAHWNRDQGSNTDAKRVCTLLTN